MTTAATNRILWVEGSPKGERSTSSACAIAFLDAVRAALPGAEVSHRDVWSDDAVTFDRDAALAKLGPLFGEPHTEAQAAAWARVTAEIEHVRAHDHLVISTPMWNWHLPHALKQWIDVITQPLLSFTLDREGRHIGTLGQNRPVQLILTRSSAYDGRHPELEDFQRPYLSYLLGLLGYGEISELVVEPTTAWTPEEREAIRAGAIASARDAGTAYARRHGAGATPIRLDGGTC